MLNRKTILQITLPPVLLILATLLLYSQTLYSEFHFDDHPYIIDSTEILTLSDSATKLKSSFFRPDRLLVTLSFAVNYHIHKFELPGYHIINIIFHGLNGVLIYYLLQYLSLLDNAKNKEINQKVTTILAVIVALIFLCHPVAVNSVTYITQRHVLMATFFYLFGFLSYVKGRHTTTSSLKYFWLICCLIAFWGAIHCKPMTLTFPFILFAFEIIWFSRTKKSWRIFSLWIICLSALVLGLLLFYAFKAGLFTADASIVGFTSNELWSPWEHFLTESIVFLHYWKILFLPLSTWLSADHYFNVIKTISSSVVCSWLLHFCIFYSALKAYQAGLRFFVFGVLWFYITLTPPYLVLPIQDVMVDYKTYLPSFAIACILMECACLCYMKYAYKPVFIVAAIILGSFIIITIERNKVFMTEESFWSDVIRKYPSEARPYNNRGLYFLNQKQYSKAIKDFNKAISLKPNYSLAYANLGDTYQKKGDTKNALLQYETSLKLDPKNADGLVRVANIYARRGGWGKAVTIYEKAINLEPENVKASYNLALGYGHLKEYDKALKSFAHVITLDANHDKAITAIGAIYYQQGDTTTAKNYFLKSLKIHSTSPDTLYNLAACYAKEGNLRRAIQVAKELIEIDSQRGHRLLDQLQNQL